MKAYEIAFAPKDKTAALFLKNRLTGIMRSNPGLGLAYRKDRTRVYVNQLSTPVENILNRMTAPREIKEVEYAF